jgi:hypothetical protein
MLAFGKLRRVRDVITSIPIRRIASSVNAAVVALLGLGTIGIAAFLLLREFRHARKPTPYFQYRFSANGSPLPPLRSAIGPVAHGPLVGSRGWWKGQSSPITDRMFVTFEFTRLRVEEHILQANVRLFVPRELRRAIWDGTRGAYVANRYQPAFIYDWLPLADGKRLEKLRPEYSSKKLSVQIITPIAQSEPFASSPSFSMDKLFEIGSLFNDQRIPFQQQVDLPLTTWSSSSYPNDWYSFEGAIYTSLERPLGVQNQQLPVTALLVGDDLAEQAVTTYLDNNSTSVTIVVERSPATIAYVYIMSLVPVGFALLIFHELFLKKGRRPVGEALAAIVATALTVLGIRQVLVPPFIEGITRVDLILGVGLALVLSLTFIRYAIDNWRGDKLDREALPQ